MYLYALLKLNIPTITHKFLVTGHTQNEGDCMHSCIKRGKKEGFKEWPNLHTLTMDPCDTPGQKEW